MRKKITPRFAQEEGHNAGAGTHWDLRCSSGDFLTGPDGAPPVPSDGVLSEGDKRDSKGQMPGTRQH